MSKRGGHEEETGKVKERLALFLSERSGDTVPLEEMARRFGLSSDQILEEIGEISMPELVLFRGEDMVYPWKRDDFFYSLHLPQGMDGMESFPEFRVLHYITLDSTNSLAKRMAGEGAAEGTIIVSDSQTGGRGRGGRIWHSPPFVNIYFSVILRPPPCRGRATPLTLIPILAGLAGQETLKGYGIDSEIRWPNDIIAEGGKVAGILVESAEEMEGEPFVVVGVGLNVNAGESDLPPDLARDATSLMMLVGGKQAPGKRVQRGPIFNDLLFRLFRWYDLFLRDEGEEIRRTWEKRSGMVGKMVRVEVGGKELSGKVAGLGADGSLLIEDRMGGIRGIRSGDLEILRMMEG